MPSIDWTRSSFSVRGPGCSSTVGISISSDANISDWPRPILNHWVVPPRSRARTEHDKERDHGADYPLGSATNARDAHDPWPHRAAVARHPGHEPAADHPVRSAL